MKHKYNIDIDRPLPSDEQIARHKDFGRILADYHHLTQPIYRKPLYKNPKAFAGLALILAMALLVFWTVEQDEKDQAEAKQSQELPAEIRLAAENSFLKAPLPALEIPVRTVLLPAHKAQAVVLPKGLTVTVPAAAFETAAGAPVTGEVQVAIRAVAQPAELIAMGLPMQAQQGLISPLLVLDIQASQQGAPLRLKAGTRIEVEQQVDMGLSRPFEVHVLDVGSRTWRGAATDPISPTTRRENAASLHQDDGFHVVQYDDQGQVIPEPRPAKGGREIKVIRFALPSLGIFCLGETTGLSDNVFQHRLRFTDPQGQPLPLLTLYGLPRGLNTVQFFWPTTADFTFEARVPAGTPTTFLGFLGDGRLAISQEMGTLPDTAAIHAIPMHISTAPVQDIAALTQLVAGTSGH